MPVDTALNREVGVGVRDTLGVSGAAWAPPGVFLVGGPGAGGGFSTVAPAPVTWGVFSPVSEGGHDTGRIAGSCTGCGSRAGVGGDLVTSLACGLPFGLRLFLFFLPIFHSWRPAKPAWFFWPGKRVRET